VLLPEAEPIVDAWLACGTQWRTWMNVPTGLDCAGVRAALELRGEADGDIFAGVQICERAALQAIADRREREKLGDMMGARNG
jgi:hypothetical protein